MSARVLTILCSLLAGLDAHCVSAQTPLPPTDAQSTFDLVEAPVLKVFTAKEESHEFIAYLVKWKDFEVIVSDPLARSRYREGDTIRFMAQKLSIPSSPIEVSTLNFHLLDGTSTGQKGKRPDETHISPAEKARQMKIMEGDLDAATNETERFYALKNAARSSLKSGDMERAHILATELESLSPKYQNNWNYGNAVQDANQVLGHIALSNGNLAEAKRRLLASADSNGSPQMNSFGPNMQLAKDLLEKGEREVVLEYFNRCSAFWKMGKDRLEMWTDNVNKGIVPEFGPNLKY